MKFKKLGRYRTGGTPNNMQMKIPVPRTPDGRVYRYSPNENAHPRLFVIGNRVKEIEPTAEQTARMKITPGTPQTVCPYSGVVADDGDFTHPADIKAAKDLITHAALEDMREAVGTMLSGLAKHGSKSGVTFKATKSAKAPKPRFGRRDLMRELICDHCGRDYGVFAISLFCPDCGAPNLRLHFEREVELVCKQIDLADGLGTDQEELAYRLLGNAHEDVLTAFEATLKTAFAFGVSQLPEGSPVIKPVGNDFQNIRRGRERFSLFVHDPFAMLSVKDLKVLELNIQKRHVIGHNLGVIDAKFAATSDEAKIGETVVLVGADIRAFSKIALQVVGALDDWLIDLAPTVAEEPPAVDAALSNEANQDDIQPFGELSLLATRLGKWLCEQSEKGLGGPVRDSNTILPAFDTEKSRDLEDAIAELEGEGYLRTTHFLGSGLPHINVQSELFFDFDSLVIGSKPIEDTIKIIERILTGPDSISAHALHTESEMPLRRFNPALAYVLAHVDDRRVSQVWDSEYPTRSFFLVAEDRVALKRLASRLRG